MLGGRADRILKHELVARAVGVGPTRHSVVGAGEADGTDVIVGDADGKAVVGAAVGAGDDDGAAVVGAAVGASSQRQISTECQAASESDP